MIIHTVEDGDTVYSISKQYGIPESRLVIDNALIPERKLIPGQALLVSKPTRTDVVRGGDSIGSVAERNEISVLSLLQNNPMLSASELTPSQTLNIRYDKSESKPILVHAYTGAASDADIAKRLPYISMLSVQNAARLQNGEVTPMGNRAPLLAAAKKYRVLPFLCIESTDEYGRYGENAVSQILSSPDNTERFIQSAVNTAKSGGYGGVEVVLPPASGGDAYRFAELLLALEGVCEEQGLRLASPWMPFADIAPHILENQIDTADLTPIWSYLWDDEKSAAPAAPYAKTEALLGADFVPKHAAKLLLGIPTFGIDYTKSANGYRKRIVGAGDALLKANAPTLSAKFDDESRTPYVVYTEDEHRFPVEHILRYEDARSYFEKLGLVDKFGLGGVSVQSLEHDAPVFWQMLNQRYEIAKY